MPKITCVRFALLFLVISIHILVAANIVEFKHKYITRHTCGTACYDVALNVYYLSALYVSLKEEEIQKIIY
jgi:hypothetical protein